MGFRIRFTAAVAFAGLAALSVTLASCGGGGSSTPAASDGQMTAASVRVTAAAGAGAASASSATTLSASSSSSRRVTFERLQEILATGEAQRVEIELFPVGLTAEEVEVEEPEEILEEEEIESRIVEIVRNPISLAPTGFKLELGGPDNNVVVGFTPETEFEDERNSSEEISLEEFVSRVQAALDEGEPPPVEVERDPPFIPAQDPDVATFIATEIELEDEADEPEIDFNVDADNVSAATLLTCGLDQGIQVLDLCIAIVPGTEIEVE